MLGSLSNKTKHYVSYSLYISAIVFIVATFLVAAIGTLIIPNISTLNTNYTFPAILPQPLSGTVNSLPIPNHMGLWNTSMNNVDKVDEAVLAAVALANTNSISDMSVISQMISGAIMTTMKFSYTLSPMGLTTAIFLSLSAVTTGCAIASFYLLGQKFEKHQLVTISVTFVLSAIIAVVFLALKLNVEDAKTHPAKYVSLFQKDTTLNSSTGVYEPNGGITVTTFWIICLTFVAMIGATMAGLIGLTTYDIAIGLLRGHVSKNGDEVTGQTRVAQQNPLGSSLKKK
ncbi:MAG: hypothetical protein Ta2E_02270 [Mycoplasmoidaceae bacterium]|nr:MAG: hypothetical protein Ta2E_02270 [Mycoplasmoidaceae bacterium]